MSRIMHLGDICLTLMNTSYFAPDPLKTNNELPSDHSSLSNQKKRFNQASIVIIKTFSIFANKHLTIINYQDKHAIN